MITMQYTMGGGPHGGNHHREVYDGGHDHCAEYHSGDYDDDYDNGADDGHHENATVLTKIVTQDTGRVIMLLKSRIPAHGVMGLPGMHAVQLDMSGNNPLCSRSNTHWLPDSC